MEKIEDKLIQALDNEQHDGLLNFTTKKIKELNAHILRELHLSKQTYHELCKKLKDYKYVDEINDLKYGTYIRWIPIHDPEHLFLTKGAIFCSLLITENGLYCVCKNFGSSMRHFRIHMETNLIFQKLTTQELIILSALDHLSASSSK
jgi:hypothetical protein